MSTFHLNAYLQRIHWQHPLKADLATLHALIQAHIRAIPFENLDVLLGRPIKIDLNSVQNKLVDQQRGGYCFEHSTLIAAALKQIGFQVEPKLARVTYIAPRQQVPRTHMFLTVLLNEQTWIVDVGFSLPPLYALPLISCEQPAPNTTHWLRQEGAFWQMYIRHRDEITQAWVTTLEEEGPADFEMSNHYVSTHPQSHIKQRLIIRVDNAQGRLTVLNQDITDTRGTHIQRTQLSNRSALRQWLHQHCGFDLPAIDHIHIPSLPDWN